MMRNKSAWSLLVHSPHGLLQIDRIRANLQQPLHCGRIAALLQQCQECKRVHSPQPILNAGCSPVALDDGTTRGRAQHGIRRRDCGAELAEDRTQRFAVNGPVVNLRQARTQL